MDRQTNASPNALVAAFRACRGHIAQAAGLSALLNLLYIAPSLYMLQVYDRVVPTRGTVTLAMLTLIFCFAVATIGALDYLRSRILVRASVRLDRLLADRITGALFSAAGRSGASASVLRELDGFRQTMTGAGLLALLDAPWAPIYILVCFALHPLIGLLALVSAALLMLVSWLSERANKAALGQASTAASESYLSLDHSLRRSEVVSALGMQPALVAHHRRERALGLAWQVEASFRTALFVSLSKSLRLMLGSLALGVGALLAIQGKITPGAIFASSLLISRALAPIDQITGAWKALILAWNARRTIATLLDAYGEPQAHTRLPDPQGAISAERLRVLTPARDRVLLADINFSLQPGEMLGVLGASGAGKSTLARVLAGAIAADGGSVRLDGANVTDWPDDQIAAAIGYVPQEGSLLRGTIRDNIARFEGALGGDPAAIDARVTAAAQLSGVHEMILALPQGYDTELGWGGAGLSVGQSQRIALARALYSEPRVVILDEPNAHLDTDGEAQLIETLGRLREAKVTLVIVAHRLGILRDVDHLMVLDKGMITQFGTRNDVVRRLSGDDGLRRAA